MGAGKLLVFIVCAVIITSIVVYVVKASETEHIDYGMTLNVTSARVVGFNTNPYLDFGTANPGSSVSKTLQIQTASKLVLAIPQPDGELSGWISAKIRVGTDKINLPVIIFIPSDAQEKIYNGTLTIKLIKLR